ncbi:MAG: hypothetical protein COA30_05655 [Sulfurimonas sp.]|nr:MAG: hypothetical protein COA30_05655 [Sulfurimonas sp.]
MENALIGVLIGAIITYMLNYLLEKSKHRMLMKKYLYNIKREKLEELYLQIEGTNQFSIENITKMYLVLQNGIMAYNDIKSKNTSDDFVKLTNTINMYFSNDAKLKILNDRLSEAFKEGQKINTLIMYGKNNNKDEVRGLLVEKWKLFTDTLLEIKEELPKIFENMNK